MTLVASVPPSSTAVRRPPVPPSVLLVVDSLDVGGAERYVVDLALELRGRGAGVEVACSMDGPLHADLTAARVPVHRCSDRLAKRRFDARYARSLRALVATRDYDLVHAHVYASIVAAGVAVAGTSVPLVITEHTEAPWRNRRARVASRLAYRRAARVTVVSEAIRDLIVGHFRTPADKVRYVPNAVRPHDGSEADELPCSRDGSVLIGRVGRLQPEKGMEVFVDAAAELAGDWPEAEFLIIGDGPLRAELEGHVARLGVRDRVHFLGWRSDARAVIAQLDVLAVSSHNDGSPLAILEAMTSGVPVVATDCGGIPGQVRHGVDGLLVRPGDAGAFAGALASLLRDPGRTRAMGDAARQHAEAEFGYPLMVDRITGVYSAACRA
jgi:glycosyltransferase involved in cell wall biosynthesis